MHAGETRLARVADNRWREAVEAVAAGYSIARSKKALRQWQMARAKHSRSSVGLTGQALEQAMSGVLATHPEFLKGVPRPRNLQPRALWGAAAAQSRKRTDPPDAVRPKGRKA